MKKKMLIVEEKLETAEIISNYLNEHNNEIGEIKIILDGENIEHIIRQYRPDYILVELKTKNIDNVNFIEKIKNLDTKILIQSKDVKLVNKIHYEYYGKIAKVYIKPYKIQELNKDLTKMALEIPSLKMKIEKEISNFNFNKSSKGYEYIIEGLIETSENPRILKNMEKELFPCLSEKLKKDTPENVKWSLQKIMKSMIRYTDTDIILKYFPYSSHPTLKVFLTTINEKIEK